MTNQPLFLQGAVANIGKNIFQAGGFRSAGVGTGSKTIGTIIRDFFAGASKTAIKPKIALPKLPKIGKPSGGTKLLIGTGIVTTGVLGTELFLTTPEGQRTLDTIDDSIIKLGEVGEGLGDTVGDLTNFFSNNPILLPLLLGLGIILVVKS